MVPFFVTTRSLLKYLFEVHHYNFLYSPSHSPFPFIALFFLSSTSHHLIYILIKFLYCLPPSLKMNFMMAGIFILIIVCFVYFLLSAWYITGIEYLLNKANLHLKCIHYSKNLYLHITILLIFPQL